MEELKENKSIVTSYRLSQETKDKVQQQLKDLGLTQDQYFNKVVSVMELENVKQNSFLNKDTTIIQSNLEAILNSFINLADSSNNLISNKNTELEELKNKYKDMLLNKENCITTQSEELQHVYSNLSVLQNENEEHKNELLNIKIEYNKQLDQLESSLKDKTLIVEEYKCKNDMLLSDLAEHKKFKVELEEYKKLLADSQTRSIDLSNSIKDKDYNINILDKSMEKLTQEHKKELTTVQKENELNIKLEIADIKEELTNKSNADQLKYNKEIEIYQGKYKALLEELELQRTIPKVKEDVEIVKNK